MFIQDCPKVKLQLIDSAFLGKSDLQSISIALDLHPLFLEMASKPGLIILESASNTRPILESNID